MKNEELEAKNFYNFIWFFRGELMEIRNGVRAREALGRFDRRALKRVGAIKNVVGYRGITSNELTPRALKILKTFMFGGVLLPDTKHDYLSLPDEVGIADYWPVKT